MDVCLTHPFCWPYVRRGTERHMDELGTWLSGAGHRVTTVSTSPGPTTVERSSAGERVLLAARWHPLLGRLRLGPQHTFILASRGCLARLEADVVHSFGFTDFLAVRWSRKEPPRRHVLQMNGAPIPAAYYRRFPPERWMIRQALEGADVVVACSRFVAELLHEHHGVTPVVEAPGVSLDRFPLGDGPADGRPTILSVANFDVPRKGLRVLVEAFRRVKACVPDARLRLSGQLSPERASAVLSPLPADVRDAIEVLGLGSPADVPGQYRGASVTVLASMWEPSGTVMVESWASGTPVVATDHGGLPEFFTEGVGSLVPPGSTGEEASDADAFASAILEQLGRGHDPAVRSACRAHATRWDWRCAGPRVERLYEA